MGVVTLSYELNFNASASVNGLPARLSASPATVAVPAGTSANVTLVVTAPDQVSTTTYIFSVVRLPEAAEAQFVTVRDLGHRRTHLIAPLAPLDSRSRAKQIVPAPPQVAPQVDTSAPISSSAAGLNWTVAVDLAGFASATGIRGFFCPLRLVPALTPAPAAPLPAVVVSGQAPSAAFSTPAATAGVYSFTLNVRARRAALRSLPLSQLPALFCPSSSPPEKPTPLFLPTQNTSGAPLLGPLGYAVQYGPMLLGASAWSFPPALSTGKVRFALRGADAAGNPVLGAARSVPPKEIAVFACPVGSAAAAAALPVPCSASAARGAVAQDADGTYSVVLSLPTPGLLAVQAVGDSASADPTVRGVLLGSARASLRLPPLSPPQPAVLQVAAADPSPSQSRLVLFCGGAAPAQPAAAAAAGAACNPDGTYAAGLVALRLDVFDEFGRPVLSGGLAVAVAISPSVFTGLSVQDNFNGTYIIAFDVFEPAVLSVSATIAGAAVGGGAASVVVAAGGISAASAVGDVPATVQAGATLSLTLAALDRTGLSVASTADASRITAFFLPGGSTAGTVVRPAANPQQDGFSYRITLPAPALAGPYQVAVQLDGVQVNLGRLSSIQVVPGPPAALAISQVGSADGTAAFSLAVADAYGNPAPDALFSGTWVTPKSAVTRIPYDSPLWLFPAVAEYGLQLGNVTDPGSYQLTVTVDGTAVTNTTVVSVLPGLPSALSTYSGVPRYAAVGQVVEFTVLLRDSLGRRILAAGLDASLAVVATGAAFGTAAATVWSVVDEPGLPGVYRVTLVPDQLDTLTVTLFAGAAPFAQARGLIWGEMAARPRPCRCGLNPERAPLWDRKCSRFSMKPLAFSALLDAGPRDHRRGGDARDGGGVLRDRRRAGVRPRGYVRRPRPPPVLCPVHAAARGQRRAVRRAAHPAAAVGPLRPPARRLPARGRCAEPPHLHPRLLPHARGGLRGCRHPQRSARAQQPARLHGPGVGGGPARVVLRLRAAGAPRADAAAPGRQRLRGARPARPLQQHGGPDVAAAGAGAGALRLRLGRAGRRAGPRGARRRGQQRRGAPRPRHGAPAPSPTVSASRGPSACCSLVHVLSPPVVSLSTSALRR